MVRMLIGWLGLFMLMGFAAADVPAGGPVAWVEIGNINVEHCLSLLDGADGQNEPATAGESKCRRNLAEGDSPSRYLYFDYDPAAGRLHRPVYVTVEYFDEGFGFFQIQYDSADLKARERGAYKEGTTELLLDSRKWRKATFELPDARFDGRQNLGADFRLCCSGRLAVRKVTVEMERSPDFERQPQAQRERVAACAGKLSPPPGIQVVFGGPEAAYAHQGAQILADLRLLAPMMKAIGATSVESYVKWDFVEPSCDEWDWSLYDGIVAILRENGLKWTPFIVIGPAYATPAWFRGSSESVFARCLEHGTDSKIQSIWSPFLAARFNHFIAEFAEHYGTDKVIESIVIGVSGDFGEAIYPVTGGGWTSVVPGEYHTHSGYWCGDEYARSDFRQYIADEYGNIGTLNAAWGTNYSSFDEVAPFVPDASRSARARLDFLKWYRGRMTKWAGFCLATVRDYFPRTDLYLCTGGDGQPAHGSDFSAQCKAAAKAGAGVRITNEASDYALNFATTRLVAAAARCYGAYYAFEPAGAVTTNGIAARVYNAVTSRVRGIHTYYPTILAQPGGIAVWSSSYRWLGAGTSRRPQVAVLFPQTALSLKWGGFYEKVMLLRDALDFDLVDESMIRDGALAHYKVLVILDGKVIEREDIAGILAWVRAGGIIVACNFGGFATVEADSSQFSEIFDVASGRSPAVKSCGAGLSVYIADGWDGDRKPVAGIAQALDSLSTRIQSNLVPDGVVDGIYISDIGRRLLIFNSTDSDVEREIQVGIGRRSKVKLAPHSITVVES